MPNYNAPKIPTSEVKTARTKEQDFTKYLSKAAKLKLGIETPQKKDLPIGASDLTFAADVKPDSLNLPKLPVHGEVQIQKEVDQNLLAAKDRNEAILQRMSNQRAEQAKAAKATAEVVAVPHPAANPVETTIGGHPLSVSKNGEDIKPMTPGDLNTVVPVSQLEVAAPTPKTRGIMGSLSKVANYFKGGAAIPKAETNNNSNLEHQKQVDKAVEQNSVMAYRAAAKELANLRTQAGVDNGSIKATTFSRDGQLILKFEVVPNGQGNLETVKINTVTVLNPDNSTTVSSFYTVDGQNAASIANLQHGPSAVVAQEYSFAN